MSFMRVIEWYERRADAKVARKRETWRLKKENEVALLELKRADPVKVKET
jgi:hypothetical protein